MTNYLISFVMAINHAGYYIFLTDGNEWNKTLSYSNAFSKFCVDVYVDMLSSR